MRLSLRFIIPLLLALGAVPLGLIGAAVRLSVRWDQAF